MRTARNGSGNPVITGWDVVSPFGTGRARFTAGLWGGWDPVSTVDVSGAERACLVPGFDPRQALGADGTRGMDRLTGLAVLAVGQLLDGPVGAAVAASPDDSGLVLGTTAGSIASTMDFTRSSLTAKRPFHVDPALVPNSVMNCAAAQCAIWHRLRGPNATIAAGRASALMALSYPRRLLAAGHASRVVCGAVEECSAARSMLEPRGVLGEGCAVLLLESPAGGEDPLAELVAVRSGVHHGADAGVVLARAVRSLLATSDPADVWAVSTSDTGPERQVAAAMFDAAVLDRVPPVPFGDTGAATGAFQIAAVLGARGRVPGATGRLALITTVCRDGAVACALLRLW